VLLHVALASGQSPEPAVSYEAPADCGSQGEFEARVRARTRNHTLEPTGESHPSRFDIQLRHEEPKVLGSITIYETTGDANTREIEAASCSEAVDGLALIAALILDPNSLLTQPSTTAEPKPTPAPAPAPPAPVARPIEPAPKPPPKKRFGSGFDLSGSGLMPGVADRWGLGLEAGPGFTTDAIVPSGSLFRLSGRAAWASISKGPDGTADLQWWAINASLCPVLLGLDGALLGTLCVSGEWGKLQGTGRKTLNHATRTSTWWSIGPALLGRWKVLSPLFVQLGFEGLVPLNRDSFLLGDAIAYEAPAVAWRGQLGLGVGAW
jgi:hypothetical protein